MNLHHLLFMCLLIAHHLYAWLMMSAAAHSLKDHMFFLMLKYETFRIPVRQTQMRLCVLSKISGPFFTPDLCLVARGGCSHQCTVAPGKGVVCSCPPGLHLDSSNKTCEVVDYCSRHLKCSQVCEQYKTTVKCSCYPGWMLDSDGDSCHSTGNRPEPSNVCFSDAAGYLQRAALPVCGCSNNTFVLGRDAPALHLISSWNLSCCASE